MGRGVRFQIKLSARDRRQLDELLSGGLQSVRTTLRALALRQMDQGQSTPVVGREPWSFRQSRLANRQAVRARRAGASVVRRRTSGQSSGPGPAPEPADYRRGLLATACRAGALDGAAADRRGHQTQTGSARGPRDHSGVAGKPRSEAVAGKKCGAWRSWTRSTSPAWRTCSRSTKRRCQSTNQ